MSELDPMEDDETDLVVNEMRGILKGKALEEPPVQKMHKYVRSTRNPALALVHSLRIGLRQLGGLETPEDVLYVRKKKRRRRVIRKVTKPKTEVAKIPNKPKQKKRTTSKRVSRKPKRTIAKPRKAPGPIKRQKARKPARKKRPVRKVKRKISGKERLLRLLAKSRRK